jgi:uncharacterized protein with GYD domain
MPSYVVLMNFTEKGVADIEQMPDGIQKGIERFETLGGKVNAIYMVMGKYDLVAVVDAPSDEMVMTYLLELARFGNVRTKTLKAFSLEAFGEWVKNLPEEED